MPNQSTPEIDRLNEIAHRPDKRSVTRWTPLVDLPDAIQAVRDTEARVRRHEWAAAEANEILARKQAVREIVEALREIIVGNGTDHDPYARGMTDAADFIERAFLNGEGSDE